MLTGVEVPRFAGLNLVADPQETGPGGAVDCLNVVLDRGRVLKSRYGHVTFSASQGSYCRKMVPCYQTTGTKRLIVNPYGFLTALKSDGSIDVQYVLPAGGEVVTGAVRFAAPGSEHVYLSNGHDSIYRWDGVTFTQPPITGATVDGAAMAVTPTDNRLVVGNFPISSQFSRVRFSDPGDPVTFPTNNYVDVRPGDGESIQEIVSWRDMVFVFKETCFAVFRGEATTDSTGQPIFDYQLVDTGIGCGFPGQAVAANDGVYFVNPRGVWRTTGGPAQLVSEAIDPVFTNQFRSVTSVQAYNVGAQGTVDAAAFIYAFNDRIYLAMPTGTSTVNNRLFVYDPRIDAWTVWDTLLRGLVAFKASHTTELYFAEANDLGRVRKFDETVTTDSGSAIASRWRSGFWTPGTAGSVATVREWLIDGTGTITFKTAVNDSDSLGSGTSVALGGSLSQKRARAAIRGRNVSYEISAASGAWAVSRVIPLVRGQRPAGLAA